MASLSSVRLTLVVALFLGSAAVLIPPSPADAARKQAAPTQTASLGTEPSLLGQFGDWGAYAASPGGRKVCFALGKPMSAQTNPPNRPRDPAFLFVSSRPAENVRNEISVTVGYPLKPNTEATAVIGQSKFVLYTQQDGAWIKNAAEEARLVEAMQKSGDIVISGVSGRGTQSTDRYSLKGLREALARANEECR